MAELNTTESWALFRICSNCNKEYELERQYESEDKLINNFQNCPNCGERDDAWVCLKRRQIITKVSQETKDAIKAKGYFADKDNLNEVVLDSPDLKKCADCGKENETVKLREKGTGLQCYKCYKDELYFDEEYK